MIEPGNIIMLFLNLALGFGFAAPLSRRVRQVFQPPQRFSVLYAALIGVYFVESAAFAAGMATNVFTIGLSFVWGLILGFVFRERSGRTSGILKTTLLFSLYTSLPALSFLAVPCMFAFSEWSILTADGGQHFGIPGFVPWPLNTILGFSSAVALSALIFKTVITTGIVSIFIHLAESRRLTAVNRAKTHNKRLQTDASRH